MATIVAYSDRQNGWTMSTSRDDLGHCVRGVYIEKRPFVVSPEDTILSKSHKLEKKIKSVETRIMNLPADLENIILDYAGPIYAPDIFHMCREYNFLQIFDEIWKSGDRVYLDLFDQWSNYIWERFEFPTKTWSQDDEAYFTVRLLRTIDIDSEMAIIDINIYDIIYFIILTNLVGPAEVRREIDSWALRI